jgi:hypothetical protein
MRHVIPAAQENEDGTRKSAVQPEHVPVTSFTIARTAEVYSESNA